MSVYTIVVGIVFAVVLDTAVSALLSGAAAFVLALSWLIGASAQEVLSLVIFLFIKHMYDVGDRVEIDGQLHTVKEIRLCVTIPFLREHDADGVYRLSTIFIDIRGCTVQAPHVVLNTKFILFLFYFFFGGKGGKCVMHLNARGRRVWDSKLGIVF